MSNKIGNKITVSIFGQSHSEAIGCVIEGLPAGFRPNMDRILNDIDRRRGGKNRYSTTRKETDIPEIISGMVGGYTCGAPLCAIFANADTKSNDYANLRDIPRPGHADYTAHVRTEGYNDIRGGGEYSGRLTLPLTFAGSFVKQILEEKGIYIGAHIASVGIISDVLYDPVNLTREDLIPRPFPTLDEMTGEAMEEYMTLIANEGDSIGGIIECAAIGLPAGLGSPMFEGIESEVAKIIFGIPAIKGIEFGAGFAVSSMKGSGNNDPFEYKNGKVITSTNNCGGILGGITNGMPLIFRCAVKPTPSIALEQNSISLSGGVRAKLKITGRHDPCIVPRAVPVVEAALAIAIINQL
ncbi:MAG: chorismate synthase [Ruminococcaceae bacterium]|nr:chorismate synthase [Oscillospiraceae bacterium]